MQSENNTTTFMTGATGFLGLFTLRELLKRGRRVVAMLRPPLEESSTRLEAGLSGLGVSAAEVIREKRLVLVPGELPEGLPKPEWGRTDDILHCAASLKLLADGSGEPFRTNLDGTRALLRWAEQHGVGTFHAVSTAYVCGWNGGQIHEAIHRTSPRFQTEYERSKWMAESLLADWGATNERRVTLLRPSFLVGDSETGYTTQYCGFYQLARLVSILKEQHHSNGNGTHIPLRIPGREDDVHNLVPVDFVARVIAEIVSRAEFHGRVYHLTNPNPPTNALVKGCLEDYFKMRGGYFVEPTSLNGDRSDDEALVWNEMIHPRISYSPRFAQENTAEVMRLAGLDFPTLNRDRFFRLLDYAVTQRWGRRNPSIVSH